MNDHHDEFTEAMWQHMQKVNDMATAKIRDLRAEIKALREELKDRDPQLWEMAEEICSLQLRVASLTSHDAAGMPTSSSQEPGK